MKSFLIVIVRPLIRIKRKSVIFVQVLSAYFRSRVNNIYSFSINDAVLHFRERNWHMRQVEVIGENEENRHLRIEDMEFYWPKNFGTDDLPWIYAEIFEDTVKNPSSYCHDKATLEENDWVIDAGASEGFFSAYALKKTKGTILIFEPVQELKSAMTATFKNVCETGRVEIISAGLGKQKGKMELILNLDHPSDASLTGTNDASKRQIEITTIDASIEQFGLTGRGFIKMDIEGAEMDALEGAFDTLKKLKPALAIAVYHEYENAYKCSEIIKKANPNYIIEFRGLNGYFKGKARPYILFAY